MESEFAGMILDSDLETPDPQTLISTHSADRNLADRIATSRQRKIAPQSKFNSSTFVRKPIVEFPTAEAQKRARTLPANEQVLFIMADLGPKDTGAEIRSAEDEHVLCMIKLIDQNQILIKPDFGRKPYRIESRSGIKFLALKF